jgi:LacI family transcriptional regulator
MRRLEGHPSVTTDDNRGGQLAAEHLLQLGHRRVGIVAGDQLASTGRDRTLGFRRTYEAAGFPVGDDYVIASEFSTAAGVRAGAALLSLPDPPTAIFAVHDLIALGVMGAIREAGRTLGTDVVLIGFNDLELAATLPVPLTSVSSDLEKMGRLSFDMLMSRIHEKPVESVLLEPSLIARATTLGG